MQIRPRYIIITNVLLVVMAALVLALAGIVLLATSETALTLPARQAAQETTPAPPQVSLNYRASASYSGQYKCTKPAVVRIQECNRP